MLAAKFVEAEIKAWLQDTRPNLINPVEFYPVLARKIIEALELYKSSCSTPKKTFFEKIHPICKHGNFEEFGCTECIKEVLEK